MKLFEAGIALMTATVLAAISPSHAAASPRLRPLLSRPDLFTTLASSKKVEAYRLGATWAEACDSMPMSVSSPFDCLETIAEIRPRSQKAVPSLIGLLSRCTWTRYKGESLRGVPSLGFRIGGDSLSVDLVVWLDRRKASLSRMGEGWYTASIPESLLTDVIWCLWGVDPGNEDLSLRIQDEMKRRGQRLKDAPPNDVQLISDMPPLSVEDADSNRYDEPPQPLTQVQPAYPDYAREAQIQGRVVLNVLVDHTGRVKEMKVLESRYMLDQAAMAAVKHWTFKPALLDGYPVDAWVEIPVDFHF
jgi:TonB family protein